MADNPRRRHRGQNNRPNNNNNNNPTSQSQSSGGGSPSLSSTPPPLSAMSIGERLTLASQLESRLQKQPGAPSQGGGAHSQARMKLCELLSDVLLSDPHVAMKKDCCGRLWRLCFYPQIAELRTRMSKEKNRRGKQQQQEEMKGGGGSDEALRVFLDEAIVFYEFLVGKFEDMVINSSPTTTSLSQNSHSSTGSQQVPQVGLIFNLHRLYIYLGDLFRYSQNLPSAENSYFRASRLAPGRGNPYNQLAVVAQQPQQQGGANGHPRTCVALYWYARSLLATYETFETSRSNLTRLFASNKAWLKKDCDGGGGGGEERDKVVLSRSFLGQFVELHGVLFMAKSGKKGGGNGVDWREVVGTVGRLSEAFEIFLQEQFFGDALISKMVAIHAFSVEYDFHGPQDSAAHCPPLHKIVSMGCALRFGACLCSHVYKLLVNRGKSGGNKSGNKNQNKQFAATSIRILSPLLLLCEWLGGGTLKRFNEVMCNVSGADAMSVEDDYKTFYDDAIRQFWENVAHMANELQVHYPEPISIQNVKGTLREHDVMKGFGPFTHFITHKPKSSYFHADDGGNGPANMKGFLPLQDAIIVLKPHSDSKQGNDHETITRVGRFMQFTNDMVSEFQHNDTPYLGRSVITGKYFCIHDDDSAQLSREGDVTADVSSTSTPSHYVNTISEKGVPVQNSTPSRHANTSHGNQNPSDPHETIIYSSTCPNNNTPPLLIPTAALLNLSKNKPRKAQSPKDPVKTPDQQSPLQCARDNEREHVRTDPTDSQSLLKPMDIAKMTTPSPPTDLKPPAVVVAHTDSTSKLATPPLPSLPSILPPKATTVSADPHPPPVSLPPVSALLPPPPPQAQQSLTAWDTTPHQQGGRSPTAPPSSFSFPQKKEVQPPPGFFPADAVAPSSILPPAPQSHTVPPGFSSDTAGQIPQQRMLPMPQQQMLSLSTAPYPSGGTGAIATRTAFGEIGFGTSTGGQHGYTANAATSALPPPPPPGFQTFPSGTKGASSLFEGLPQTTTASLPLFSSFKLNDNEVTGPEVDLLTTSNPFVSHGLSLLGQQIDGSSAAGAGLTGYNYPSAVPHQSSLFDDSEKKMMGTGSSLLSEFNISQNDRVLPPHNAPPFPPSLFNTDGNDANDVADNGGDCLKLPSFPMNDSNGASKSRYLFGSLDNSDSNNLDYDNGIDNIVFGGSSSIWESSKESLSRGNAKATTAQPTRPHTNNPYFV
eukprot:CAMPEP_0172501088 /NCGR_PEP_ID=MMETSP1066-20121228/145978_1 /TAXON_ID=671091 /ORGANISM="Coscinodiscus wailesii, Strain CCMP2513" /LENGTH=1214 /DNA_ID=CAMNT_0013275687 /DNA_START=512 /DNA_END=4156 /DNA_ORIENTATION=+